MPDGEIHEDDWHALETVNRVTDSHVEYRCLCGQIGASTRAFPGEDVVAKAKRAHRTHASRARKRAREAGE